MKNILKKNNIDCVDNFDQLEIFYKTKLLENCNTNQPLLILQQLREYEKQTQDFFVDSWLEDCKEKGFMIGDPREYEKQAIIFNEMINQPTQLLIKLQKTMIYIKKAITHKINNNYQSRISNFDVEEINENIMQEQEEFAEEETKEEIRNDLESFSYDYDLFDDNDEFYLNENNLKEFGL